MSCGESEEGNEGTLAERDAVSIASITVSTSSRGSGMVIARRRLILVRVRNKRECAGLFSPIAALLLGLIERLIRRLDQIGGRSVPAGDRTGETRADGGAATVGVRNTKDLNSLPKRFRHLCRSFCTGTWKHNHEFVTAVSSDQVSWSVDGPRDRGGNLT